MKKRSLLLFTALAAVLAAGCTPRRTAEPAPADGDTVEVILPSPDSDSDSDLDSTQTVNPSQDA